MEARSTNPLLDPVRESFDRKRGKKTGVVPRNWLLIILCILDLIDDSDAALHEDEVYTYDYSLKKSRTNAIDRLLEKYALPEMGLSIEGVTVRGAPGLRVFRSIEGGGVIMHRPKEERHALILEAIELVREEIMKVVGQKPVELPFHEFAQSAKFVKALLDAVKNRSNGRVEQALVGAKLQLRFPRTEISANVSFAADRQTGRECDFDVGDLRVIVSVAPKEQHFQSAMQLSDANRQVVLVVAEKSFPAARKRIKDAGYLGPVTVLTIGDYVTNNMSEISRELGISAGEMCMKLVAEYNRRVSFERDESLKVVVPE